MEKPQEGIEPSASCYMALFDKTFSKKLCYHASALPLS
jgi:hypothetical protein